MAEQQAAPAPAPAAVAGARRSPAAPQPAHPCYVSGRIESHPRQRELPRPHPGGRPTATAALQGRQAWLHGRWQLWCIVSLRLDAPERVCTPHDKCRPANALGSAPKRTRANCMHLQLITKFIAKPLASPAPASKRHAPPAAPPATGSTRGMACSAASGLASRCTAVDKPRAASARRSAPQPPSRSVPRHGGRPQTLCHSLEYGEKLRGPCGCGSISAPLPPLPAANPSRSPLPQTASPADFFRFATLGQMEEEDRDLDDDDELESSGADSDTIVAIVTGAQQGAVSIIRMSGDLAVAIALHVFRPAGEQPAGKAWMPESHRVYYGWAVDMYGSKLDEVRFQWGRFDGSVFALPCDTWLARGARIAVRHVACKGCAQSRRAAARCRRWRAAPSNWTALPSTELLPCRASAECRCCCLQCWSRAATQRRMSLKSTPTAAASPRNGCCRCGWAVGQWARGCWGRAAASPWAAAAEPLDSR